MWVRRISSIGELYIQSFLECESTWHLYAKLPSSHSIQYLEIIELFSIVFTAYQYIFNMNRFNQRNKQQNSIKNNDIEEEPVSVI